MNRPTRTARGQPLLVLGLVLASWIGGRALVISAEQTDRLNSIAVTKPADRPLAIAPTASGRPDQPQVPATVAMRPGKPGGALAPWTLPDRAPPPPVAVSVPSWQPAPPVAMPPAPLAQPPAFVPVAPRVAAGHQLLWMAALSQLPLPGELAGQGPMAVAPSQPTPAALPRWSADGWLLWRRDGAGVPAGGFAPSTYGASQAGAVLRYRLAPQSEFRPALYLRATSALQSPRGEEVALGLSARPIPGLPVMTMAELRVTHFNTGTKLRPAAALVTELPPVILPLKLRAETYVQAGYVGGTGATGFIDGQLRIDRPLARLGKAELRLGAGTWGGAQEGASRLDAGPGAVLGFPVGKSNARLAMDWRFRVAGNAAPKSGPAITLSAGF